MLKSQTCSPSKVQGACRASGTHRHMHRCQPPRLPTPPCSRAPQSPEVPAASSHAAKGNQPAPWPSLARITCPHSKTNPRRPLPRCACSRGRRPLKNSWRACSASPVQHRTCTYPAACGLAPLGTQPARRSCSPWAPPTRQAHSAAHEALHGRQRSSCGGPCALKTGTAASAFVEPAPRDALP